MKVYVYDERSPAKGRLYATLTDLRRDAWDIHLNPSRNKCDWGHFDDRSPDTADGHDMAEILYGSWGRCIHGAEQVNEHLNMYQ